MPYTIANVTIVPQRTSVRINVELSEIGIFQCGVYLSGAASPVSLYAIINQGHLTTTPATDTFLSISGLVASTDYKLFCLTKSESNVLTTSYLRMIENELTFTTSCCRHITVDLETKDVSSELDTLNVLKITWDALPASDIYVNLTTNYRFNASQPFLGQMDPFQPATFKLKTALKTSSFFSSVPAKREPGQYFLDFNMSSWNSDELAKYEIVYVEHSPKLTVIDKYEPPTPNVSASYFSDDGTIVYIYFDSATNLANQGFGMFSCSAIVNFPAASTSQCVWESRTLLHLYSDIDNPLNVGDTINLIANVVKAKCSNTAAVCEGWAYSSGTITYTITTAIDAVVPAPNIDAAALIGSCDQFVLDLSLAAGSGGRDWTSMDITVTSPNNFDVTKLTEFFNSTYVQSPPTPGGIDLFELGGIYEIDVAVCNFLGKCSLSGEYKHTVEYEPVTRPIAYILGETQKLKSKNRLVVKCVAYVEKCDGDLYNSDFYIANAQSTADLSYTWTIFKDGVEDTSLSAYAGVSSVPELSLPPYSLVVDSVYLVSLTVTYAVTGLSTVDTIDIFIKTDDIRAIIGGGKEITLPLATTALLDGSISVDGNIDPTVATGVAAGLSFEWTCFLSSPLDVDDCGVTMEVQASADILKITPVDSLVKDYTNSTSTITLTVFDDSGRRPSTTTITVTILPGGAPVITLSAEATKILPSSKLKLFSTVQLNSSAELTWSVDSPAVSLDLSEVSLTPVTRTATKGTYQFNLVIMESSLPIRGVLTFSLQAGSSSASIDIAMISPPLPGRMIVLPDGGLEMSTTFDVGTSLWTDLELPITYSFGYVTNEGTFLSMQSRSEDTYALMTLPAGTEDAMFEKTVFVRAFNPLEASESLSKVIIVRRQEVTAAEFTSIVSEQLNNAEGETDSNVVKQIVNVAASSMNNVNCSLAPNCSLIHRGPCFKAAHTCGECLASHVGEEGHDNTACYDTTNSSIQNSTIMESCLIDSDCALFQECNTTIEKCYYPPKTCKFDCNGLGDCIFKNIKSGAVLDECVRGETTCVARCSCSEGFAGETCEHSQAELDAKLQAREDMAVALSNAVAAEPLNTPDAVQDLIAMIEALSANPYELTVSACDSISSMVSLALDGVSTLDMAYEDLSSLYDTLDDCQTVYIDNGQSIPLDSTRRRYLAAASSAINDLISTYIKIVSNGIEGGQDLVSGAKKNFRTTNFFSSNTDIMTFDVAQTSAEIAANAATSSLTVNLGGSGGGDVSTSIVESAYQMYGSSENNALVGNPVRAKFMRSTVSTMATVQFNLINAVDGVSYGEQLESNETFVTGCARATYGEHNYTCVSGYVLEHVCAGNATSASTLRTECPSSTYMPLCGLIIGGQVYTENPDPNGNTSCSVVGYSNVSVICECNVYIFDSDSVEGRRRLDAVGDSGGIEVVSMSSFVADGFVNTVLSSSDWTFEDLGRVWIIIVLVTTMWAVGLGTVFILSTKRYHDYLVKDNKVGVMDDSEGFADDAAKKEYILSFIDQIFPAVFIDSTWSWAGLSREIRAYHRHYTLFTMTGKGANRTRLVTALQLLSLHTMVFWVMAVTFEIQFPTDDGSCALEETEDGCLSEKSMFDNDRDKCKWSATDNSCDYTEVTLTLRMLMLIILVMAFVQAIFNIPIDILFQDIINAPLAASLDAEKKVAMAASANAIESGNPTQLKRRMSSRRGSELDQTHILARAQPQTLMMKVKTFFNRHFRWEKTRLLSDDHVDMHGRVVQLGEGTNLKTNTEVTLNASEDRSLVFDYPELVTFVGIQREHLLENHPEAVAEFDEKWG
jgi:hypothetical protein